MSIRMHPNRKASATQQWMIHGCHIRNEANPNQVLDIKDVFLGNDKVKVKAFKEEDKSQEWSFEFLPDQALTFRYFA